MKIEYFDSHAHLFDKKIDENEIDFSDLSHVVVPAYSMDNLIDALNFCSNYEKCHCALGVHPQFLNSFDYEKLKLALEKNIDIMCAVGEIGLDTNYATNFDFQIDAFIKQLDLATKLNLPTIIHLRSKIAFNTFFDILKTHQTKAILHCFSGDKEDLLKAIENDCYISFATNLTYKGNVKLRELAELVPLNRLLIETDSPNMRPANLGGRGINYPQNVKFVALKLSEILNIPLEKIAEITKNNAKNAFNL